MIVCLCRRVTERTVEAAIDAGARDPDAIALATGAGTDCGGCREDLRARAERGPAPCSTPPCRGCPRAEPPRSSAA